MTTKLLSANPPVILTFSTLDPSGSSGIQADIETAASLGTHCAPLITSLCSSGEAMARESVAVDPELLVHQAHSILAEMDVRAVKLGFLGSIENIQAVHKILEPLPNLPLVCHPALCLWEQPSAEQNAFAEAFRSLILPLTKVAVFSHFEAKYLAREADTLAASAQELLNTHCENILVTGTGKRVQETRNTFFQRGAKPLHFDWHQESAASQGTSSTLAMCTAAYLAHGFSLLQAIEEAQHFTWQASRASRRIGFGRSTLHRLFWADANIDLSGKPLNKNSH